MRSNEQSTITGKHEENLTSRERSLRNLRPFSATNQPSHHPGRPKKDHVLLREIDRALKMRFQADTQEPKRSFYRLMAEALARKAAKGDVDAMKVIFDRQLGRVKDAEETDRPQTIIVSVARNVPRSFKAEDLDLGRS
jgi:hypothetical protein